MNLPVNFIPHTLLRPRGIGTSVSIASRATEVILRALSLLSKRPDFYFSVDSAWAVCGLAARQPDARDGIAELAETKRLSVGMSWGGIEWLTHPEVFIRDLQIGFDSLAVVGVVPTVVVLRSAELSGVLRVLDGAGVNTIVSTQPGGVPSDLPRHIDLTRHRDLALDAASGDPIGRRDAEKKLKETTEVIPLGEELWSPTEDLLRELGEWAEDASFQIAYSTWDGARQPDEPEVESQQTTDSLRGVILPGVYAQLSDVSRTLLRAERILAMTELLGVTKPDRTTALDTLWKRHLEDLSGDYLGSADRAKRDELRVSCEGLSAQAKNLQDDAERLIASSVSAGEGPDGIISLVVFNPSSRARSEAVETDIIYYGENRATAFDRYEFYRLVDADGAVVPVEEIGGKQVETAEIRIRFVAGDVPAFGYKTFYFVPKPSVSPGQMIPIQAPGAMIPDFPEPKFAIDDVEDRISEPRRGLRLARTFATGVFSLAVDEITGRADLIHRKSGRSLLAGLRIEGREDSLRSAPGTFDPTGRLFAHNIERVDLVESGEVSARIEIVGKIGSSPVTVGLRVYADLPIVDVDVAVSWRDRVPMLLELCAPLAATLAGGMYDLPYSSGTWTRTGEDIRAQRWVTADGDGQGIRIASDRTPLVISNTEIRSPLLFSTPDPASYAYNKMWLAYPDRVLYGFRITLTDTGVCPVCDELNETFSLQPVYDRAAARTRPASGSALSVSSDSVRLSALRQVPGGIEARLYDVSGKGGSAKLQVPASVSEMTETDLRGTPIAKATDTVSLGPNEMKSIRLEV